MTVVRCIKTRTAFPEQIQLNKLYWLDESTIWKDTDGNKFAVIYIDKQKTVKIGMLNTKHFELVQPMETYSIQIKFADDNKWLSFANGFESENEAQRFIDDNRGTLFGHSDVASIYTEKNRYYI